MFYWSLITQFQLTRKQRNVVKDVNQNLLLSKISLEEKCDIMWCTDYLLTIRFISFLFHQQILCFDSNNFIIDVFISQNYKKVFNNF